MLRVLRLAAASAIAAILFTLAGAAAWAAGVEDYLRGPAVRMVEISPDGAKIALLAHGGGAAELRVVDAEKRTVVYALKLGDSLVIKITWVSPDMLIIVSESRSNSFLSNGDRFQDTAVDIRTGAARSLLNNGDPALTAILAPPAVARLNQPAQIFVASGRRLFRTTPGSWTASRVEEGLPWTTEFIVGADGQPAARTDFDQDHAEWSLWANAGMSWRRIHTEDDPEAPPEVLGFDVDGRSLLVRTVDGGGFTLHRAGLDDGSWSLAPPNYQGQGLLFDPRTELAMAVEGEGPGQGPLRFLAAADQTAWDMVLRAFPGERTALTSWSDDHRRLVVRVDGPKTGDAFFLVDLNKGKVDWLADGFAGLGPGAFGARHWIRYKASDGADIGAVLTTPVDSRGALPLVVLANPTFGGAELADTDDLALGLASRGYLVLELQAGAVKGRAAASATSAVGPRIVGDLVDGVRFLTQSGSADPNRVCIVGFNSGGYAALAGATLAPKGVYRCAVAVEAVSDVKSYLSDIDGRTRHQALWAKRTWRRLVGAETIGDPRLDEASPRLHSVDASGPILLIHAKNALAVPYAQSADMARALESAGKTVELVALAADDAFMQHEDTRLTTLMTTVAFIEKHNPPAPGQGSF